MTISREIIEQVRRTDLVALVQARGITLKKNGKSWFGLCPFHNDKNPSLSINTKENLWQCFGCGAAGDAIRFVELIDRVPFTEAVKRRLCQRHAIERPARRRRYHPTAQGPGGAHG